MLREPITSGERLALTCEVCDEAKTPIDTSTAKKVEFFLAKPDHGILQVEGHVVADCPGVVESEPVLFDEIGTWEVQVKVALGEDKHYTTHIEKFKVIACEVEERDAALPIDDVIEYRFKGESFSEPPSSYEFGPKKTNAYLHVWPPGREKSKPTMKVKAELVRKDRVRASVRINVPGVWEFQAEVVESGMATIGERFKVSYADTHTGADIDDESETFTLVDDIENTLEPPDVEKKRTCGECDFFEDAGRGVGMCAEKGTFTIDSLDASDCEPWTEKKDG